MNFDPMTVPSNPRSFHEEAHFQVVCAVCGGGGDYEAHHVVPKHRLKRMGFHELLYDPRNCLRLCKYDKRCHMNREHGGVNKVTIATENLTDENICFIWQTLGMAGQNFLERHHTGVDRRYTCHPEGGCAICQPQPQP